MSRATRGFTPGLPIPRAGFDERSDPEEQFLDLVQDPDDLLVGNPVVDDPPLAVPRDEAAVRETVQMHRGVRLAQPSSVHDLAGPDRPVPERFEHAETGRIAEPAKQLRPEVDMVVFHISV